MMAGRRVGRQEREKQSRFEKGGPVGGGLSCSRYPTEYSVKAGGVGEYCSARKGQNSKIGPNPALTPSKFTYTALSTPYPHTSNTCRYVMMSGGQCRLSHMPVACQVRRK